MARRTPQKTWQITDIDGSNERTVTLASFRAELDERAVYAKAVMDAMRRGDMAGCTAAQEAMRARFPN